MHSMSGGVGSVRDRWGACFLSMGCSLQVVQNTLLAEEENRNMIRGPRPDIQSHMQIFKDSRYL